LNGFIAAIQLGHAKLREQDWDWDLAYQEKSPEHMAVI
jgi:hypothetical protein